MTDLPGAGLLGHISQALNDRSWIVSGLLLLSAASMVLVKSIELWYTIPLVMLRYLTEPRVSGLSANVSLTEPAAA